MNRLEVELLGGAPIRLVPFSEMRSKGCQGEIAPAAIQGNKVHSAMGDAVTVPAAVQTAQMAGAARSHGSGALIIFVLKPPLFAISLSSFLPSSIVFIALLLCLPFECTPAQYDSVNVLI